MHFMTTYIFIKNCSSFTEKLQGYNGSVLSST